MEMEKIDSTTNAEMMRKDIYDHIKDPKSDLKYVLDENCDFADVKVIKRALSSLNSVSYGGFSDYAIAIRGGVTDETANKVKETGIVELEVGMGQRSIPVDNPTYQQVWGSSATYIPWSDGQPKFKLGQKGNRIVSLRLSDLSRTQEDKIIE